MPIIYLKNTHTHNKGKEHINFEQNIKTNLNNKKQTKTKLIKINQNDGANGDI